MVGEPVEPSPPKKTFTVFRVSALLNVTAQHKQAGQAQAFVLGLSDGDVLWQGYFLA